MIKETAKNKSTAKRSKSTELLKPLEEDIKASIVKKTTAKKDVKPKTATKKISEKSTSSDKEVLPKEKSTRTTKEKTEKRVSTKTSMPKEKAEQKERIPKVKKTVKKFAESEMEMIIEKMQAMKAHNLLSMDLRNVAGSSFDYFIIAHAPSSTQVAAIADGVEDILREKLSLRAWHTEGYQNAEWILLDYGSIVVHVFREDVRVHYRLEDLWGDALITHYDSEN